MTGATGTVTSATAEVLTVTTDPQIGCLACVTGTGCGLGPILALFIGTGRRTLQLRNSPPALFQAGDLVRIVLRRDRLVLLALLAYALPLTSIFAGAGLALAVAPGGGDAATVGGAMVGAAVAWVLLRLAGNSPDMCDLLQAEITHTP